MYPPSHRLFFSKFTILNMYPILRVGLKSKQVVVGWFYNIHALIAPVDIFCLAVQHGGTHGPQLSLQMTFSPSSLCCMCAMSSSRLGGSSQLSSVPTRLLCPVIPPHLHTTVLILSGCCVIGLKRQTLLSSVLLGPTILPMILKNFLHLFFTTVHFFLDLGYFLLIVSFLDFAGSILILYPWH